MRFKIDKELDQSQDVLVLGLFEGDKERYTAVSKELADELNEVIKKKIFSPKFGEKYKTNVSKQKIIIYGLGKKDKFTLEKVRRIFGKVVKCVRASKLESMSTNLLELFSSTKVDVENFGQAAAEAMILANYSFSKYLSEERKEKIKQLNLVVVKCNKSEDVLDKSMQIGKVIAENTNFVRDLVNEPAEVVTPEYMENIARKIANDKKMQIKVLNKQELQKLGMNALLGVSKGSDLAPKLVILEYKNGSGKATALVGKGITFDSGGYNLKPTKYIEEMKQDMAGAAAVLGTMKAVAELGLKKNLIGVMPLCENMVNGSAQRPGDIVKAYNGKTIEIGNTDAEGRLILADALAYTEDKYKPEVMIDLATLTGACVVALGYYAAGMVSKDKKLISELVKSGEQSGDCVWELPFYDGYQDWMDGSISDLNNVAVKGKGYEAGAVTAGVFLSKFVKKSKWAHLDIAGTAYWSVDGDYLSKGATGSGVRVLMYWLLGS